MEIRRGGRMLGVIKKRSILSFLLAIVLLVSSILGYLVYILYFDLDRVPKNEFVLESASPSGEYSVQFYRNGGSATTNATIAGVLTFQNENKKPKTIF